MADKDNKQSGKESQEKSSGQEAANVADLSIPTIIAALHENAVNKANAAAKGVKVINSAIDNESGKASLKSAGEHIISVLPLKPETPVEKKTAIEVLQTYVQWFVGPDLAKKVDDSTVKSLLEAPKGESVHVMSFKQFLLEADGEDSSTESSSGSSTEDGTSAEGKEEDSSKPETKSTEEGGTKEEDGNGEEKDKSKAGYYIPYNLKVEGLPQTALKDAMKKFAMTFFDDVTIKASGLFGGGASFTVKDVKDNLRSTFGPIDPDDLEEKVSKEINSIRHPNTDNAQVSIRDKTTLISDLGSAIDASQKKQINSAEYSLWIKIQEYDPKKPIFNPRVVADIVQSSITGLFKKFKNKITKNDVIYIENYKDQHDDTKKLEQLNKDVPEPSEFTGYMRSERASYSDVWSKIDKALDKIGKHPQLKNSPLAQECHNAWVKFKQQHEKDDERTSKDKPGSDAIQNYFKSFVDAYTKAFDKNKKQQNLHESWDIELQAIKDLGKLDAFKQFVFESLYGEAEDASSGSSSTVDEEPLDASRLQEITHEVFARRIKDIPFQVKVGPKEAVIQALSKYDTEGVIDKFKEFENGIAVDFGQLMKESVKTSIMSMLFEDGPVSLPSPSDVESAFDLVCKKAEISSRGDVISIWYERLETTGKSGKPKSELSEADASSDDDQKTRDKLENITSAFRNRLVDIGKSSTKLSIKPIAKVGSSSTVLAWLDKYGLATDKAKEKLDKSKYAAVHVLKIPAKFDDSGKLKKGSLGYSSYTKDNVLQALNSSLGTKIDEPVFEFESTANSNLKYNETKIPAKCKVRMMFFDSLPSGGEGTDPNPSKADYPDAYILPIGGKPLPPPKDIEKDIDDYLGDDGDQTKYDDLYIIPMPGLKYKDKEYNTYA